MRIPTRVAGDTIQTYIDKSLELFHAAGGRIIDLPTTLGPNAGRTIARIDFKNKIIYRFKGAEVQDTVEELLHFRQALRAGYWGKGGVPPALLAKWEKAVDILFENLGFVPR